MKEIIDGLEIDWDDLQEPSGEPNRKDSFIYTGFPESNLKCCICGENADRLVPILNKWICDSCCHPLSRVSIEMTT